MGKTRNEASGAAFPKGVAKPAQRALASIGVTRLEQLARHRESELLALHGMGPTAIRALETALVERGLSFAAESRGKK